LIKQLKIKFNFLIIFVVFITSCSILSKYSTKEKEALLIKNLQKWESFQLEGIVEVNYKIFSFRKNIVLRKKNDLFRSDIFDAGLFGLAPTPFLSIYIDSLLTIRLAGKDELIEIPPEELNKDFPYFKYLLDLKEIKNHKQQIIDNGKLEIDDLTFHFSKNMEITQIQNVSKNFSVLLTYGKELEEISLFADNKVIADIIIDKILFSDIRINKIN